MRLFALFLVSCAALGCRTGTLPDPNDPADVGLRQPEVLRNNLRSASDMLNQRKLRGEIDDAKYRQLIRDYARDLVTESDLSKIPEDEAWQYAEVVITAENWKLAKAVLEVAVKHARNSKNEDRRVNDSLRLARVHAELGALQEALELARGTFDAAPADKPPILPAVLYEVVPAARGKGHDVEVAKLLEDAVQQHREAMVDPSTEPGRAFLLARAHHIGRAWALVVNIYDRAGRSDLAREAAVRAVEVNSTLGRV